MHRGGTRLDIGAHDLKGVQRSAKTCFGISNDGRMPMNVALALHVLDLIGTTQRVVDAPRELRAAIGWVEALVGIHPAREIVVRGDLPTRQVDRLETSADHLDRLVAGHGPQRIDVVLGVQQFPQALGTRLGERVFDRE